MSQLGYLVANFPSLYDLAVLALLARWAHKQIQWLPCEFFEPLVLEILHLLRLLQYMLVFSEAIHIMQNDLHYYHHFYRSGYLMRRIVTILGYLIYNSRIFDTFDGVSMGKNTWFMWNKLLFRKKRWLMIFLW